MYEAFLHFAFPKFLLATDSINIRLPIYKLVFISRQNPDTTLNVAWCFSPTFVKILKRKLLQVGSRKINSSKIWKLPELSSKDWVLSQSVLGPQPLFGSCNRTHKNRMWIATLMLLRSKSHMWPSILITTVSIVVHVFLNQTYNIWIKKMIIDHTLVEASRWKSCMQAFDWGKNGLKSIIILDNS